MINILLHALLILLHALLWQDDFDEKLPHWFWASPLLNARSHLEPIRGKKSEEGNTQPLGGKNVSES